jgi:hypothetical protein
MIRWVCTNNPFYVISAGLFLVGLRVSFGDPRQAADTWAMMSGLVGYTILLAATACFLVRYAKVWDDVRTVLLLVVLMFLATSVTFDEVLVLTPGRGFICYLAGLAFAIAVSEGVLRGIGLKLPAQFRGPYYLILCLFFLYPLGLSGLVAAPQSEAMLWGLYGFGPAAGLVFLTLLPAIRRGPEYVRNNGSPWPWPLYPWTLFGLLALAVPARSFLLCWSMHLLGNGERDTLVFGPHFLAPFGLVVAILLLEMGLVSRRNGVVAIALALPLALVVLGLIGHRHDLIYGRFLERFVTRLGGLPAFVTLVAASAFYVYAAIRRAPLATEAITAALVGFAVIGPGTLSWGDWTAVQAGPLFAAGALQLALGIWRQSSWRLIVGSVASAAGLAVAGGFAPSPWGGVMLFHALVLLALIIGAWCEDWFAGLLRGLGIFGAFAAGVVAMLIDAPAGIPGWWLVVYPVAVGMLLGVYGYLLRELFATAAAGLLATLWGGMHVAKGYQTLRHTVVGLDYLAGSLLIFGLAVAVSVAKSGLRRRPVEPAGGSGVMTTLGPDTSGLRLDARRDTSRLRRAARPQDWRSR